jgi:transcriptional regulator with XRE-family HTH domain|tara:strand:- start:1154 stop:1399 length:246 start_codon:yes stop_codon:yes gene_type:complete
LKTVDIYLDERKLSVEDVSEGTGIHFERVEAIALGRWTPNPKDRARIAEFLEVGIDDVVWGHNMDPRNVRYRRVGLEKDFQ